MPVADRFSAFGTTVFAEISRLAIQHNAVNLGQGFPDFDGPAHVKQAAIDAIEVDYEVLEPVTDVLRAMEDDAPLLHDGVYTQGLPEQPENPSNVSNYMTITKGDASAAFDKADVVVERTFVTPMVHQGYIEPHACVVDTGADGVVSVEGGTEHAFTPRPLRFVRHTSLGNSSFPGGFVARVVEFEVFGD